MLFKSPHGSTRRLEERVQSISCKFRSLNIFSQHDVPDCAAHKSLESLYLAINKARILFLASMYPTLEEQNVVTPVEEEIWIALVTLNVSE